jgi:hypothetical protein
VEVEAETKLTIGLIVRIGPCASFGLLTTTCVLVELDSAIFLTGPDLFSAAAASLRFLLASSSA